MIENLKIGCAVRKDQVMRILTEDIDADNVLDAIDFDVWFVEHVRDGAPMREAFEGKNTALARCDELKTWEEFDVMKGFLSSIGDWAKWRGVVENG